MITVWATFTRLPAPFTLPRTLGPHQLGCATLEIDAATGPVPLHVEVASVPDDDEEARPLGIAWVIGNPDEDRAERGRLDDVGPSLSVDLDVPAGDTLLLSLCDLGPADADELPRATELALSVVLLVGAALAAAVAMLALLPLGRGMGAVAADFEALTIRDSTFWLLTSKGRLYEFAEGRHGERVTYRTLDPPRGPA